LKMTPQGANKSIQNANTLTLKGALEFH